MNIAEKQSNNNSIVSVISTAIQIPGVKVNRSAFLSEQFKKEPQEQIIQILEKGPVEAGYGKRELRKKAEKLINDRTLLSSGASFVSGIPGGLAMAATIPADMLQFYGVALRLAQELIYLYGCSDLWSEGELDSDKVTNQLVIYCGVMLGASGAVEAVRLMTSALAKQALKKIPQKALTKTFFYPVIKSIAKFFGKTMTKSVLAKGVSKAIPLIGGVVSGGITLATMRPMGMRLADALECAIFDYTQATFEADWSEIVEICEQEETEAHENAEAALEVEVIENDETVRKVEEPAFDEIMEKINRAKQMLDMGVITEKEFETIKARLIEKV